VKIEFELVKQGAVHINSATFLHLSENAFVLSLDCREKRPAGLVTFSDEDEDRPAEISIAVFPDEETLHVAEDAPRDEDGSYHVVSVPWDSVSKAALKKIERLPDGLFE